MSDEVRIDGDAGLRPPPDFDEICVRNLLDTPGTILFFKDAESRFLRASVDCAEINGRTQQEMVGLTDFDLTDRDHASELFDDEQRIIATGQSLIDKEEAGRLVDRPGTWVETSKFPLRDADGTIIGTFGYSRDVSRWELAERELERMAEAYEAAHEQQVLVEAQLRAVLNGSMDAIAKYDRELRYQYVNPAGERFKGASLDALVGRTDRETGMPEAWVDTYETAMRGVLETGHSDDIEFSGIEAPSGEPSWFHLRLSPDREASGGIVGVLVSIRDVTGLKRAEQAQAHLALHDPLTGLANRSLLMDRIGKALIRLERTPGLLAVFFIDLDRFKDVNDSYGHEVGDRVLVDVARRLELIARRDDTVARLGGDEYIVLCERVTLVDVEAIAGRIVAALTEPFGDEGASFQRSASVGVMVTDDPCASASSLLHGADSAMYRAKMAGRNRFEVHQPG